MRKILIIGMDATKAVRSSAVNLKLISHVIASGFEPKVIEITKPAGELTRKS